MSDRFNVIAIGAGAAGLFCAARAGQRGLSVLLIDHAKVLGEKIRISGGGRCNFTNIHASPANYLSQNPHFCRSALARYTPQDFVALVKRHRIAYHEKKLGQLFCDDSAQQIIDMLADECRAGGVTLLHPASIHAIEKSDQFRVCTDRGVFVSPNVVISTGGLSVPATGATPFGYQIAAQFGIAVTPLRAGLVPLALDAPDLERYADLTGVSFDAIVRTQTLKKMHFRENVLLTHRGLSGPAILQISNYWQAGDELLLNLLPEISGAEWLADVRSRNASFTAALSQHVPQRFAEAWAAQHPPSKPIAQWTKGDLTAVATLLNAWPLKPSGTLGYKKAEVTLGGIDTQALSSQTMEAKAVPGLHFIGEVVDVTGWLGGYNFQWAWASAAACAEGLRA